MSLPPFRSMHLLHAVLGVLIFGYLMGWASWWIVYPDQREICRWAVWFCTLFLFAPVAALYVMLFEAVRQDRIEMRRRS